MTQPASATPRTRERPPWPVLAAAVVWLLDAALLCSVRFAAAPADGGSVDRIRAELGSATVSGASDGAWTWALPVVAVLLLGFGVALLLGRLWARLGLVAAGAAAVVLLAMDGRWETLVAMTLLLAGALLTVLPSAGRFLGAVR